jgi:hypothetical protein
MNRQLTAFQRTCETALASALRDVGRELERRELHGQAETFVRARVAGTGITVYIYEDEAQFHRKDKLAGLYERADFSSLDELQSAFVLGVLEAADDS